MLGSTLLSFLLLFVPSLHAIPPNTKGHHRLHREQSEELDETINRDNLQPLSDLSAAEHAHISTYSNQIPTQSTHNTQSELSPAKKTARIEAPASMTEAEKVTWREMRKKESQRKYQESLKLNPDKRKKRSYNKNLNRINREAKMTVAEKKATRHRHYVKIKEKVLNRGECSRSLHARRYILNHLESGTASEYQIARLQSMRQHDRQYQYEKRKRSKKKGNNQLPGDNSDSST
ncbi:uncharacterized protein FA14DRAFT_162586 [Meira miltonrushii]|uniref:Uncharacterized protein n=1 Tax=Meira miltonrushii TaxID=1280837 RepID=A0A316V2E6_9BASI|nr:uncharacterized protein FA14DRAFT_162586 [Meira miltonrushii]PWN31632.1 hypothetical protein FA14DRAFT_162586 [Meira miltonrushii]